jgi:hypothetical protein
MAPNSGPVHPTRTTTAAHPELTRGRSWAAASTIVRTAQSETTSARPRASAILHRRASMTRAMAIAMSTPAQAQRTSTEGNHVGAAKAMPTTQSTRRAARSRTTNAGPRRNPRSPKRKRLPLAKAVSVSRIARPGLEGLREREVDGGPVARAELGLERPDTFEIVERLPPPARPREPRGDATRERGEAERHVRCATTGDVSHRQVDEELDRPARSLGVAQEVFEEPALSRVDGDRAQEADAAPVHFCDEVAALVRQLEGLDVHQEPHARHLVSEVPPLDERLDGETRGEPATHVLGGEMANPNALGPRASELFAQRSVGAEGLVPRARIPGRLQADELRRHANDVQEASLHGEEDHASPFAARRLHHALRHVSNSLGRAHGRPRHHPSSPRIDVRDAGVSVEEVAKSALRDLECGRVPAPRAEKVEDALAFAIVWIDLSAHQSPE